MRLIDCLRDELNTNFLTELGPIMWDDDDLEEECFSAKGDKNQYIIIGGSHAGRLVDAMDTEGYKVADLSAPGWRASEFNVEEAAKSLQACIAERKPTDEGSDIIILRLLDNSIFFAQDSAGRSLLRRDYNDRKYHVVGSLEIATREEFKEVFNMCVPILRADGECQKIILMPIARYITNKCCNKMNHVTNFNRPDYAKNISKSLDDIKDWSKALAFTKRIRNFKVICPMELLQLDLTDASDENQLTTVWDTDPVPLNQLGYTMLAEGILNVASKVAFNRAADGAQGGQAVAHRKETA
jgi:hypothetical protein